ncbi:MULTISPECIES: DNA-processing protein DprA [Holospora]|uniref:DNA-processing protein DprA n=1 Tax=Holospora TaxID=44747 RepID=UPI00139F29C9|nr:MULTISPECIES: DNA-processing protein DprA [Holospora]
MYASSKRLELPVALDAEKKLSYLRLARSENIGPIGFFHLIEKFKHPENALSRLKAQPIYKGRICSADEAQKEIDLHHANRYHLISYFEPEYPEYLRQLKDPPIFLSVCGRIELLKSSCFAVVGARNASQSAHTWIQQHIPFLKSSSQTITSGLARGVDTWAHEAALNADMPTIAVIAGGLGNIYPLENKTLYHRIAEQGAVISEDPLHLSPQAQLFPKRNRIISGLSWGILIIEAGIKSGALLSAKYALDQNRCIFVLPGHPLDSRSHGGNKLIKEGACLVETASDIKKEFPKSIPRMSFCAKEEEETDYLLSCSNTSSFLGIESQTSEHSDVLRLLLERISTVPTSIETLRKELKVSSICLQNMLVELELQGYIERYPGDAVVAVPQEGGSCVEAHCS